MSDLPFPGTADHSPASWLAARGEIFRVFDDRTQDSGNVSFCVRNDQGVWFVKTAGTDPAERAWFDFQDRVALLRNAAVLAGSVGHPALPPLRQVIESETHGPWLVYEWVDGDLLNVPAAERQSPACSYQRFRTLALAETLRALRTIVDAHVALEAANWVAIDLYDGSMIYDFARRRMWLVDLDNYRRGPSVNDMGRMFGSTRFMAPEEFERGAPLDWITNVFTLGRMFEVFCGDQLTPALRELVNTATREDRSQRPQSIRALADALDALVQGDW